MPNSHLPLRLDRFCFSVPSAVWHWAGKVTEFEDQVTSTLTAHVSSRWCADVHRCVATMLPCRDMCMLQSDVEGTSVYQAILDTTGDWQTVTVPWHEFVLMNGTDAQTVRSCGFCRSW
jgi:hypothetical protein